MSKLRPNQKSRNTEGALANSALSHWAVPGAIFLLTILSFSPVLQNEFVNWDDPDNFLENLNYRGLRWSNLTWMFTTFHMTLYRPLTWITYGFDYLLWGMEPFGYHLTSLFLHAVNGLLFYFLTLRILAMAYPEPARRDYWFNIAAAFAALLFALHPLRVEAVAWASARESVLGGGFFLLTVLFYLRTVGRPNSSFAHYWIWTTITWLSFVFSLLSKVSGVTLPLVLLVLDIYPLRRLDADARTWLRPPFRRVLLEKTPFVIVASIISVIGVLAKERFGTVATLADYDVLTRVNQVMYGMAFYIWKTVVPLELSPLYEKLSYHMKFSALDIRSTLAVLTLTTGFVLARKRWPAGLASWLCYAFILTPVLGFIPYGPQIVADRYSYLSNLSWAMLAGAGLHTCRPLRFDERKTARFYILVCVVAGLVVATLASLTWNYAKVWHDSERLWRHALAIDPKSSFAHNNLGLVLAQRGETSEAMRKFREATEIDPNFAEAHNNLGHLLVSQGSLEEGIQELRKAILIKPAFAEAHNNLGNALAERGELNEAVKQLHEALRANPEYAAAFYNLGRVSAKQGQLEKAIDSYKRALTLSPMSPDIHNNLGLLLMSRGNLEDAVSHFRETLRLEPNYAKAHFNLARARVKQGFADDAVRHFEEALRLQPGVAEIHEGLARALVLKGMNEEAMQHFEAALRILKASQQSSARP